jgi:hypothetical protein
MLPQRTKANEIEYKTNFERLQAQAMAERALFQKLGLGDMIDDGFALHTALVSGLNKMFINHLKQSWVPKTMRMLTVERSKVDLEDTKLGLPAADEEGLADDTSQNIRQSVERVSLPKSLVYLSIDRSR